MSDYNRADATFGGYAAVLGVIVLVVLAMAMIVSARQEEHIPSVDYTADAAALRDTAPYESRVPRGLPEGWVPTSSTLETGDALPGEEPAEPVRWVLGFATPEDRHAEFGISGAEPQEFIAEMGRNGGPDGESDVRGETWERYYNETETWRSLVNRDEEATLVVSGNAGYPELEVLAESLETQENAE